MVKSKNVIVQLKKIIQGGNLKSSAFSLLPLEKKKLVKSLLWSILGLVALFTADYLQKFGLPEFLAFLTPFVPFLINFLLKWSQQNEYKVIK